MPKLSADDDRRMLFFTQRAHVFKASHDLLDKLDDKDIESKTFIKAINRYMRDYATHPQISIDFLNLFNSSASTASLPKAQLKALEFALENDQNLMAERNRTSIAKKNKLLDLTGLISILLCFLLCAHSEDNKTKIQIFLIKVIISAGIYHLRIEDSANDWDYLDPDDVNINNMEESRENYRPG